MTVKRRIQELRKEDIKSLVEEIQKTLAVVTIISPYKLGQETIDLLMENLPFIFTRSARVENIINESLIAGVIVKYQSRVIDLSLKKRLEDLKRDLGEGL